MYDPVVAGRRVMLRAVVAQVLIIGLLVGVFFGHDVNGAVAVAIGGLALALGNALSAMIALGGVVRASVAFNRLLLAVLVKWLVVITMLAVALSVWRLSPLPMFIGLTVGLLAYLLALNFLKQNIYSKDRLRDR